MIVWRGRVWRGRLVTERNAQGEFHRGRRRKQHVRIEGRGEIHHEGVSCSFLGTEKDRHAVLGGGRIIPDYGEDTAVVLRSVAWVRIVDPLFDDGEGHPI